MFIPGVFWDVAPTLLHLCQRDGHQVRDRDVVSDAEGRFGPGWRPGGLRSVHRRGLLHGQSHRWQVSGRLSCRPPMDFGGRYSYNLSTPPKRLEVLHGDTGGDAELRLLLHWPVPVPHDQVSPRTAKCVCVLSFLMISLFSWELEEAEIFFFFFFLTTSGGLSWGSTCCLAPCWSPSPSASWPASSLAGPLITYSGTQANSRDWVCVVFFLGALRAAKKHKLRRSPTALITVSDEEAPPWR